jgi:outer membrane protein assembly factor BamA
VDPGDRYSEKALRKLRDRLLNLQLFRYASVQRDTASEEPPFEETERGAEDETGRGGEDRAGAGAADEAQAATKDAGGARTTAKHQEQPRPGAEPESEPGAAETRAPAQETWPMVIRVEERPPRSVSIGGGWASGQGPRGAVRWSHRNFLGGARRVSTSVSGSALEQLANIRFQQPYLFDTRAALIANSLWRRRSRTSYDANTAEFSIGPRWPLGPGWVLEASYRFGWTDVRNITDSSNEVLRAQKGSGLLSGFGARVRRARLDHPTNPTRGTWLQLGVATNLKALGSDFDWMRYDAEARGYVPLGPTVAAFRAQYRVIEPLGSTEPDEVPLGERLFLGGPHTGRGFPFEELGPLDGQGEPVGGVTSLLLSAEWRIPVWGPLTLIGFVDAGQVSQTSFGFEASQIGIGTGAGLAVSTPIGPIAGHVAYPVRPLESTQRIRLALTIGNSF